MRTAYFRGNLMNKLVIIILWRPFQSLEVKKYNKNKIRSKIQKRVLDLMKILILIHKIKKIIVLIYLHLISSITNTSKVKKQSKVNLDYEDGSNGV